MYHDSVKLESVCGLFVGSRAFSRQRPRSGRTRERREIERERESLSGELRGGGAVEERRGGLEVGR